MYKRFTAPVIERPFTFYCDDYADGKVRTQTFQEVQLSKEWAKCFNDGDCEEICLTSTVVKITYTYYDWFKKRKINQVIYKRSKI